MPPSGASKRLILSGIFLSRYSLEFNAAQA